MSRPFTFFCDACEVEWSDGVDYTTCPRCGSDVRWIDAPPQVRTQLPSVPAMARGVLVALITVPNGCHVVYTVCIDVEPISSVIGEAL